MTQIVLPGGEPPKPAAPTMAPGGEPPKPAAPKPAAPKPAAPEPAAPEGEPPKSDEGGAGGADALRRDLVAERKSRKDAQKELATFKQNLLAALGGESDEISPEEYPRRLSAAEGRAKAAEQLVEAITAVPSGADLSRLLDSVTFRKGLAGATDVPEYVKTFLQDHPTYTADAQLAKALHSGNTRAGSTVDSAGIDEIIRGGRR